MARKNKRLKTEYYRGLGFDPRKYITSPTKPVYHKQTDTERIPQRGDIWFANLGSHPHSSVQSGCRPVIVISNNIGNNHSDTVNVLPLTRHMKKPERSRRFSKRCDSRPPLLTNSRGGSFAKRAVCIIFMRRRIRGMSMIRQGICRRSMSALPFVIS